MKVFGTKDGQSLSVHEQILAPAVVGDADVSLYKRDMSRAGWSFQQSHAGFPQHSVSLLVVTLDAGADHVLPCIRSAAGLGNEMINSHRALGYATILATMTIARNDVLAGQHDPLERHATVLPEPDDRRQSITS